MVMRCAASDGRVSDSRCEVTCALQLIEAMNSITGVNAIEKNNIAK